MTFVLSKDETFHDRTLRACGKDAAFLWELARHECAAEDGDGLMPEMLVEDAAGLFRIAWRKAAPLLVKAGFWHDHETVTACTDCMEHGGDRTTEGAYFLHEWWDSLLSKSGKADPVSRDHELRRKRLHRNARLKAMIRTRDRDLCRYCGCLTLWTADHKSVNAGTFDHVDPFGANTMANVVVACRRCNGRKKDRTPEQASMILRPEPAGYQPTIQPHPATESSPESDPETDSLVRTRETGPGRIGNGSVEGSGLDGSGSDRTTELVSASNGHTNGNGHGPTNGENA